MSKSIIRKHIQTQGMRTFVLRVGIVGGNFAIMFCLARGLGLEQFGRLSVVWSVALVVSAVISAGGPLFLLKALTGGKGLTRRAVFEQIVIYPAVLAAIVFAVLPLVFPGAVVGAMIVAALCINALFCIASVMRALGSIQISMVLRDAVPNVSLGISAYFVFDAGMEESGAILVMASFVMLLMAAIAFGFCVSRSALGKLVRTGGRGAPVQFGLWSTSVLGMVLAQIDIVFGGSILSNEEIGLYALLRRVANLVALPVSVATWVTSAPVSAAFAQGDRAGLRRASLRGSQIALIPGICLFLVAAALLPVLHWAVGDAWVAGGNFAYLLLLVAVLSQVFFAASFTVATLCGFERFAVFGRLTSIVVYALIALAAGPMLSMEGNAVAYFAGIVTGGILLWAVLRRRLGIDTSGAALFYDANNDRSQQWNPF